METPIGKALYDSPRLLWTCTVMAAVLVAADFAGAGRLSWDLPYLLAAGACLTFAVLAGEARDADSFGFRWSTRQGWRYWMKATLLVGAVLALVLLATGSIIFGWLGHSLPAPMIHSESEMARRLLWMCVTAPILEETVYRLAVMPAAIVWCGPRAAIAVGGLLFAGLHVWNGVASPENLLGGFILGWAYLKSGTIVVPLVWHSAGNLFAFACQVGYFYLYPHF